MSLPRLGARPLEVGLFAALIIALIAIGSRRTRSAVSFRSDAGDVQLNASGDIRLSTGGTLFEIVGKPAPGEELGDIRVVRDARGTVLDAVALGAIVDGAPMRLVAERPKTTPKGATAGEANVHVGPSAGIPESPLSVTITLPPGPPGEAAPFFIVTGHGTSGVAEAAARLRSEPVRRLHGRVVGGEAEVDVWGVGPDGRPILHVKPRADGTFDAVAPLVDLGFYATMAHTRASPIVPRVSRDDSELELTILPGGEAHVRVEDPDTGQALTARLIVHGVAPTADPNFGPDYRSSGAGPLIDALRGEATMPLPTGRYRVLATRGPEYTIDEQALEVAPGSSHSVRLALRHVVDTPGWVGCDFHVHARPSFDSPVLPEDRVISLIAAGVDFAVPSEHNAVGHYEPVLEALELG